MFSIENRGIKKLEDDLNEFAKKALPFATRKTLNDAAFQAQAIARADTKEGLTLRNNFTTRSIQVEQARTLNIRNQESVIGSTEEYMEDQEFGGRTKHAGQHQTVLPTSYAAGQAEGARPRTRLPRKPNKLSNIRLRKGRQMPKGASRRQKAFLTALFAAQDNHKVVFIEGGEGGRSAIYRVWGRNKKKGRFTGVKLRMLYSLRRGSTQIPKRPWLKPAFDETVRMVPAFYADALRFQLRRRGLFRSG